jgi:hypothetical protein
LLNTFELHFIIANTSHLQQLENIKDTLFVNENPQLSTRVKRTYLPTINNRKFKQVILTHFVSSAEAFFFFSRIADQIQSSFRDDFGGELLTACGGQSLP